MQDPFAEIGYLLQSRPSDDPATQASVVRRLYPTIYRLAFFAFLDPDQAIEVAHQALLQVLARLDDFKLGADFHTWSLQTALPAFRLSLRKATRLPPGSRSHHAPGGDEDGAPSTPAAGDPHQAAALLALDAESRLILALRFLERQPIPAIARGLGRRGGSTASRLDRACRHLQNAWAPSTQPDNHGGSDRAELSPAGQPMAANHRLTRRWLQAHDPSSLAEKGRPASHLAACNACLSFQKFLVQVPAELESSVSLPQLSPDELEAETARLTGRSARAQRQFIRRGRAREVFWVGMAMSVILATAWISNRLNLSTTIALPGGTPTPVQIPTPIEPPLEGARSMAQAVGESSNQVEISWDPFVSADGRWIAFTSFLDSLVPGDTNHSQDVFVLEQATGRVERVSVGEDGSQAAGDNFLPGMSADGRFVVFTSLAGNLAAGDTGVCPSGNEEMRNCPDVFLRDRDLGATHWISVGWDGSASDGASYLPVISADGNLIAFWSEAGNLVQGDRETCGNGPSRHNCLDIFIYHRGTGQMERVAVGKTLIASDINLIPLSISGDGRWLLFPVFADDELAQDLPLENHWDLFLYDRLTSTFEPVNIASDGTPGDEPSYSGQVSQDGHWVAFASSATNLIPGDDNDKVDIFVRDRLAGTTELVSLIPTQDGRARPQGITGGERFLELPQISADGRWVMFMSDATNLDTNQQIDCEYPPTCYNLYIHDRTSGRTQPITTVTTRFFPFAHLSPDGRWIVFNGDSQSCLSVDLCTGIYVTDRAAGETHPLELGHPSRHKEAGRWDEVATLGGSSGWATGVAFSPDGRQVASSSNDGRVRLWEAGSWNLEKELEGSGKAFNNVMFSPDGTYLAAGAADGNVYLWRLPAGNLFGVLDGHPGVVRTIAISPDGTRLAAGALRAVWVWEIESGTISQRFEYPGGYIKRVTFSPDGEYLAVAASDESVWVQEVRSGAARLRLGGHDGQVNDLAFSPEGGLLVTGAEDRTANLWEIDLRPGAPPTARLLRRMEHNDWVSGVQFSPDGKVLALGSYDGTISLWDVAGGALLDILLRRRQNQVLRVAFSPDGHRLAGSTVRGDVYVWELTVP